MYKWNMDKISFMKDASEVGTYYEMIADYLKKYFSPEDIICDAGCGLGYLSLHLADYVAKVSAVDIHDGALQILRDNCRKQNRSNIEVIHSSIHELEVDRPYDKMVFCFFGDMEDVLNLGRKLCSGDLFVIARNDLHHRFLKDQNIPMDRRVSFNEVCRILDEKGIEFETKTMDLEFGQPFRYLSDVPKYFQLYSYDRDTVDFTEKELAGMLFPLEHKEFKFYLPKKREIGIIRIIRNGKEW